MRNNDILSCNFWLYLAIKVLLPGFLFVGLTEVCFSKGDGERAMLEASNELRVVRDELENLMDIISTKVDDRSILSCNQSIKLALIRHL